MPRTHDSPPLPEPIEKVSLQDALEVEGFPLPEGCGHVKLEMFNDVFVLEYQVLVEGEALAKLGRALARVGEGRRE